jgi:Domain of unknown function (DUF4293)
MLQRIQSLYLLAASSLSSLCWLFPFASGDKNDTLFLDGKLTTDDNLALIILATVCIALPFLAIFLYKNYNLQKKITFATILSSISLLATAVFLLFTAGISSFGFGIAIFVPFIVFILAYLAYRGIRNDENIIKSSNRIR